MLRVNEEKREAVIVEKMDVEEEGLQFEDVDFFGIRKK